jgi:hypothetical protein
MKRHLVINRLFSKLHSSAWLTGTGGSAQGAKSPPLKHRRLLIETLEIRSLLSAVGFEADTVVFQGFSIGPSPEEQEMFELMNGFRTDPQGELDRLFSTISPPTPIEPNALTAVTYYQDPSTQEILDDWAQLHPVAPLSWNDVLWSTAIAHNESMIQHDMLTHQTPSEPPLEDRYAAAGYTDWDKIGENLFTEGESVFHVHSAFVIDWDWSLRGHRLNIMDEAYSEVGVAIENEDSPLTSVGPKVVTVEFGGGGVSASEPKIMGVVYDDLNANARYDAGEGLGGVDVTIVGPNGTYATTTLYAGGYQVPVPSGEYEVTASGGGLSSILTYDYVFVDQNNVKVDFNAADPPKSRPRLDLNGGGEGLDVALDWVEGGSNASITASMALSDRDSDQLQGATATILNWTPQTSTGLLFVSTEGTGIEATFNSSSGVLTLTGADTVENYALVLGSLTFTDQAELPVLGVREIEVVADDGELFSRSAVARVRVLPSFEPIVISENLVVNEHDGEFSAYLNLALSEPVSRYISVNYEAYAETGVADPASAGDDFLAASGSVLFAPGETSASVVLMIFGDKVPEGDETFGVALSLPSIQDPSGLTTPIQLASLANATYQVTVEDDDTPSVLGQIATFFEQGVDIAQRRGLYQFTASSTGPLAVLASFYGLVGLDQEGEIAGDANPGTIRLHSAPWDGLTPAIAEAAVGADGEAVLEFDVLAGAEYVLEFESDTNTTLDWAFANVVERINDEEVKIVGGTTSGVFELDLSGPPRLTAEGVPFAFSVSWLNGLSFEGNSSNDTLTITGSESVENWIFDPLDATLRQGDFNISVVGFEALNVDGLRTAGGKVGDTLLLFDTPGDDALNAGQGHIKFQVGDLMFTAENIADLQVEASRGGRDEAFLYDSTANDRLVAGASSSSLSGGGYEIHTTGFDETTVFAFSGGEDSAICYDSASDDQLLADPVWGAVLSGDSPEGDPYKLKTVGFHNIEVRATAGGHDVALIVDSPLQDVIRANADYVGVQDLAERRLIEVWAFEYVDVLARNVNDAVSVTVDETQGESLETVAYGPQEYGYFLTAPNSVVSVRRHGELPSGLAVPPADDPPADAYVADAPIVDAPIADAPIADAPIADAPIADAPIADAPIVDAPIVDAPIVDSTSDASDEVELQSSETIHSIAWGPYPMLDATPAAEEVSGGTQADPISSVSSQFLYDSSLVFPSISFREATSDLGSDEATDALFDDVPGIFPPEEESSHIAVGVVRERESSGDVFYLAEDAAEASELDAVLEEDLLKDPWDWTE